MLNLDLNFFSATEKVPDVPFYQMDESGTSNSSIVNADVADDESCSTRLGVTANHDVLVVAADVLGRRGRESEEVVVVETMELFPLKRGGDGGGHVAIAEDEEYLKVQKVKRSRRGPKSKSSEFRGVTFYRRTGRWESHIW